MQLRLVLTFALGLTANAAYTSERPLTVAGLSVTTWSQDATSGAQRPVVIFSHGFHGCATQSRFLMEALADAGYIVFAPNHHDATCGDGASSWAAKPELSFRRAGQWSDATYRDRADDIRRLIDALKTDERFRGRLDWSRIGLAGHSLGGYTVLGLGGAWPPWTIAGVKAILALSPYSAPYVDHKTLGQMTIPVMYQGGTRDLGISPTLRKSLGAYDQSRAPKYYVEFDKAGHFAWTNLVNTAHDGIVAYSVAFLDRYVKGDRSGTSLTQSLPDVAELRYESDLGNADIKENASGARALAGRGRRR